MTAALQVGWLVDFVPPWLSTAAILTGLTVVFVHLYAEIFRAFDIPSTGALGYVTNAGSALFLGVAFAALVGVVPWYLAGNWVLVGVLGFLGQWTQGVSAVRFIQKLLTVLTERRFPGSVRRRIGFSLLSFLVVVLLAWGVIYALVFTGTLGSPTYALVLFWTLVVFVTSLLGLLWRVRGAYGSVPTLLLVGVVLMIAGASVHNFTFLTSIRLLLLGNVGYVSGYAAACAVWLRETAA